MAVMRKSCCHLTWLGWILEEPSSEIGGTTRCVAAEIGTLILATSPTCLRRPRDEEEHSYLGSDERSHLGDCRCCLEPQRERAAGGVS